MAVAAMTFRTAKTQTWKIGSLQSPTGSEYMFGFNADTSELLWLERVGIKYSREDPEWREAEAHLRGVYTDVVTPDRYAVDIPVVASEYPMPTVDTGSPSERPKTVTRSIAGDIDYPIMPAPSDPRIVGDMSPSTIAVDDDDIVARAAAFLEEAE